ncbi:MAG TPA: AMP-binding protein, partial [Gemmatimonadota bacterium]|nr:AMP-binding protein [Gemmatimonadota bacterium]
MARDDATTIDALLPEQRTFPPPRDFVKQANARDPSIYERFDDFPDGFVEYAEMLDWDRPWDRVLDASDPPFYKWFSGGRLNACFNCVDRHLEDRGDEVALLWEGEDGSVDEITYRDLHRRVNEFAAVLREVGVREGDIVTLHLPMVPALPIAMLACARIGAPHSEVFAGFSARALATRIDDARSHHLVTIDGYYRRGEFLNHKRKADEALELADTSVKSVLVWTRHDEVHPSVEIVKGRDLVVGDLLENHAGAEIEPVSRDAEDILFLMYTSGTTGTPKGVQHRTGGYLAYATGTSKYVLDIKP